MKEPEEVVQEHVRPGQRIQLCNATLQAFYGTYGTVIEVRTCGATYRTAHIVVQMDDVALAEGHAIFYPHDLRSVPAETTSGENLRVYTPD